MVCVCSRGTTCFQCVRAVTDDNKQPFDSWSPPSAASELLPCLTTLLKHTMTSCPLDTHLCIKPFSLGALTGRFVPRQIYSTWLPCRALGKWDTNATVSVVSRLRSGAVAPGDKTATTRRRRSERDKTMNLTLNTQQRWMLCMHSKLSI